MKTSIFCLALALALTLPMTGLTEASVVPVSREEFIDPAVANILNEIIPGFAVIPLTNYTESIDCPILGELDLEFNGLLSMIDPEYAIFFNGPSGYRAVVLYAEAQQVFYTGIVNVRSDWCMGVPGWNFNVIDPAITTNVEAGIIADTYLNDVTDQIVLETRGDSLFALKDLDLLPNWVPFKDELDLLIASALSNYITDELFDDGNLANWEDGGVVHDLLEVAMDTIYIPHLSGCMVVVPGVATRSHLAFNVGVYFLPVFLILAMRRRARRIRQ